MELRPIRGAAHREIHIERPGWQLFRDGCPGGESPAEVGARADRVVTRVRGDQDKTGATTRPRLFHPDFANHAPCRDTSGRSFHANRRSVLASGSAAVNEHPAASISSAVV